ncbi:MAG: type II secretion system protein [Candidatus Nealsonbacteria bacterium]|nr:type II secretion system protein [Candidatus Nealsonbacteria bacterium]
MKRGFTIIEILVSVAIFSVVTLVALGIFNLTLRSQRQSLADQQIISQASYVMEYMSRAVRMARKDMPGSCLTVFGAAFNYETNPQSDRIRFLNYQNICQEFFLEGGRLKERKSSDSSAANFLQPLSLTSPGLTVSAFKIGPSGSWDQQDNDQPRVTFYLQISGASLQTTISQRNLDVRR